MPTPSLLHIFLPCCPHLGAVLKNFLKNFLAYFRKYAILASARALGLTPKGGTPMSITEIIALLMLVLTAVSLGNQIKK